MEAYWLRVYGRVQRVGFRRYVLDNAQRMGLAGWIRNLPDGTVEIHVQSKDPAKLEKLLELIENPPPPIHVEGIERKPVQPDPSIKHFRVIYGEMAEELQEGLGAMQSIFMEYWREFRDYRREFRDYREEFRDYRDEFRSFRNEFRSFRDEFRSFRDEFRSFRDEFRSYRREFQEFASRTDTSFKVILEKYGEISKKLTTILETLISESKETREKLDESLRLLRQLLERVTEGGKGEKTT